MICDDVLYQLSTKIEEMDDGRLAIIDKLISLGSWDGYDRNICRLSEISSHITQTYINVNIYRVYDSNNELVHTFENMQLKSILDIETVSSYITTPTGYIFNKWTPEPIEGKWEITTENSRISALFNLNQYNLYAYSNGGGTATVDKNIVEYGGTATWTATPNTGYKFTSWSDGTTTINNTKTNIQSNISLTATFEIDLKPITSTITHDGNGKAIVSVSDPSSGASVYYKTSSTGNWINGNYYQATNTITVYFKVEASGYKTKGDDNTFGMILTKTTSPGYVVKSTFTDKEIDYNTDKSKLTPEKYGYTYGYNSSEKWYTSYNIEGGSSSSCMKYYTLYITGGTSSYEQGAIITWTGTLI